jgi:mannan endo-1,4-beta-mannosidase
VQNTALLPAPSALPQYHGYISVTRNGRYFQDEAGQGFVVIGQNDAISWPGLVTLLDGSSHSLAEDYIRDLRAHGVNVSRIMLEYAHQPASYLENPVGVFSPAVVNFWDEFIALAERYGLYLLLTPYDTFWQVKHWDRYPYSAAMGGPCRTMRDWLTDPCCIQAQKARWEFAIKRWGGSPNIFAWDLMNEIDLYWGCTPAEISAYLADMATFVRALEGETWGRTHLLTASVAAPVPNGWLGEAIYNHPDLDFATTHLYVGFGVRDPMDTVEGAIETNDAVRLSLQTIRAPRPYLDTESGPLDNWIRDVEFDIKYHHNLCWAHLASGGAGSGMRWPYTHPHYLLPELRDNLLGMARFAAAIDWTAFDSRNIVHNIRLSRPGIIKAGCGDRHTAILWLLTDTRVYSAWFWEGLTVKVHHVLAGGAYTLEVWDTYKGEILAQFSAMVAEGKLNFDLPFIDPFLADIAILIRRAN